MSLLKVENINTGYGKKQVLYEVSLEINAVETVLVIGSNGSGKSTLFKAIYGILSLWNGAVYQHLAAYYLDSKWMNATAYIILIVFLYFRPYGFSGKPLKKAEI